MTTVSNVEQYLGVEVVDTSGVLIAFLKQKRIQSTKWEAQFKNLRKALYLFMLYFYVDDFTNASLYNDVKFTSEQQRIPENNHRNRSNKKIVPKTPTRNYKLLVIRKVKSVILKMVCALEALINHIRLIGKVEEPEYENRIRK